MKITKRFWKNIWDDLTGWKRQLPVLSAIIVSPRHSWLCSPQSKRRPGNNALDITPLNRDNR